LKPILNTIDFVSHSKEGGLIEIDMEIETVAHPMRGGMAPTTAPTHVLIGCICLRGVYTKV
jgi:hypothetical protein